MLNTRLRQAVVALSGLAMELSPVWADETFPATRATPHRSVSVDAIHSVALRPNHSPGAAHAPARIAPIDSRGRYPFGQFRGGYRYPFSYPYYRYGGSRLYPFGVGPYGPYGSNYGGYSGNAYDPRVYALPVPDDRPAPDALPPAPPADPAPAARPLQDRSSEPDEVSGPSVPVGPVPNAVQVYGNPIPYFGGDPFHPAYGGAQAFQTYPFGYSGDSMWFGPNRAAYGGFGYYRPTLYIDPVGPPSGQGYYSPGNAPPYYNFNMRNYGPAYRTPGGINGGLGYYAGW
jgi:hypothetical protein